MKVLGVTGGIGMGKSVAGELLQRRGVSVVDSDVLSRRETEPGSPALAEIAGVFGSELIDGDGRLRRREMADLIFSNPAARSLLEAILHPRIETSWRKQLEEWRGQGVGHAAVLIPLLFERGYELGFTVIITVACTLATQRNRLIQRGWDEAQIQARNTAQLPIAEKMERARFVVWTEGTFGCHGRQWDRILTLA